MCQKSSAWVVCRWRHGFYFFLVRSMVKREFYRALLFVHVLPTEKYQNDLESKSPS